MNLKPKQKTRDLFVALPIELLERLDKRRASLGLTRKALVQQALEEALKSK